MLMVRSKIGRWIHCINEKTGEPDFNPGPRGEPAGLGRSRSRSPSTTILHHYRLLKPGDREHRMLESGEPLDPRPPTE